MKMSNALLCAAAAGAVLAGPVAAHAGDTQGLAGAYYANINVSNIADAMTAIAGLRATASFVATEVCFPNCSGDIGDDAKLSDFLGGNATGLTADVTGLSNHVVDLNGFFHVTAADTYVFDMNSDDGAALFIDGARIVNDDGGHSLQFATGQVNLSVGFHSIEIVQFENAVVTGLDASVARGRGDFVAIGGEGFSPDAPTAGVPEPAAWALILMGFGGLGAALRARRRTLTAA